MARSGGAGGQPPSRRPPFSIPGEIDGGQRRWARASRSFSRSSLGMMIQSRISSMVRRQPRHRPVASSIWQTLMQGEGGPLRQSAQAQGPALLAPALLGLDIGEVSHLSYNPPWPVYYHKQGGLTASPPSHL